MRQAWTVVVATMSFAMCSIATAAADNQLTPKEKADGWKLLFDGKTGDGWSIAGKPIPKTNIVDGAISTRGVGEGRGAYVMFTNDSFGDFALAADFKITQECN